LAALGTLVFLGTRKPRELPIRTTQTTSARKVVNFNKQVQQRFILLGDALVPPSDNCELVLSRRMNRTVPDSIRADTLTSMAFNLLADPLILHKLSSKLIVINADEFSLDSVLAAYVLCYPFSSRTWRQLLQEVAHVAVYIKSKDSKAIEMSFYLQDLATRLIEVSKEIDWPALCKHLFAAIPQVAKNNKRFLGVKPKKELQVVASTEKLLRSGELTIEDYPCLDLTIARSKSFIPSLSKIPIHSSTRCHRTLLLNGDKKYTLSFREESAVQQHSACPQQRISLVPLVDELASVESEAGWVVSKDGLVMHNSKNSNFEPNKIRQKVINYFKSNNEPVKVSKRKSVMC